MTADRSPLSVCTAAPWETTVTDSDAAPNWSAIRPSDSRSEEVRFVFCLANALKPWAVMERVYRPAGTLRKANEPSESVVKLNVAPVESWVSLTVAPGTTASVGSVTVPLMMPEISCARVSSAKQKRMAATQAGRRKPRPPKAELFAVGIAQILGRIAAKVNDKVMDVGAK